MNTASLPNRLQLNSLLRLIADREVPNTLHSTFQKKELL